MTSVTDENGNVTAYEYDDFGRVVRTTKVFGNSAYTTYDECGNAQYEILNLKNEI